MVLSKNIIVSIVLVFVTMVLGTVGIFRFAPPENAAIVVTSLFTVTGGILAVLMPLLTQIISQQTSIAEQVKANTAKVVAVADKVEAVDAKVEVVHKATNSLTDRLVASTAVASHAEGLAEGKAAAEPRTADTGNGAPGATP